MLCPTCKSDRAHRSKRRSPAEFAASLLGRYPYRCHACGARFTVATQSGILAGIGSSSDTTVARMARRRRFLREALFYGLGIIIFLAFLMFLTRERPPTE